MQCINYFRAKQLTIWQTGSHNTHINTYLVADDMIDLRFDTRPIHHAGHMAEITELTDKKAR